MRAWCHRFGDDCNLFGYSHVLPARRTRYTSTCITGGRIRRRVRCVDKDLRSRFGLPRRERLTGLEAADARNPIRVLRDPVQSQRAEDFGVNPRVVVRHRGYRTKIVFPGFKLRWRSATRSPLLLSPSALVLPLIPVKPVASTSVTMPTWCASVGELR